MSADIYQSPRARMAVARAFLQCDRCKQMRSCAQFCAVESGATVTLNLCVRECFDALVTAIRNSKALTKFPVEDSGQ